MIRMMQKSIWILTILFLSTGCSTGSTIPQNTSDPATSTLKQEAPISIVSLEDQVLRFECLNTSNCIKDTDLSEYAMLDKPYQLGPVYFTDLLGVWVTLYSKNTVPWEQSIVYINEETNQITSLKLPTTLDDPLRAVADGRMVLVSRNASQIYIIQPDMSFKEIDVKSPIGHLIEADNHTVIGINKRPLEKNGNIYFEVFLVDVISGQFTQKSLDLPNFELIGAQTTPQAKGKYLIELVSVSQDLKKFCYLYILGEEQQTPKLGVFDVEKSEEIKATSDPQLISVPTGYAQYHDFLYVSNFGDGYGSKALLINMITLNPLIDFRQDVENFGKLIIIPFGDSFLIGTADTVELLSSNGEIINKYPLPMEWVNQQYNLMYYRK